MLLTTVDVKWLSEALMKDNDLAKSFEGSIREGR